MFARARTIMIE